MLVPFMGSVGLDAASFPGATTIDISIQQSACGTVSLDSFGYVITSSTVSLPNADLGDVRCFISCHLFASCRVSPCLETQP